MIHPVRGVDEYSHRGPRIRRRRHTTPQRSAFRFPAGSDEGGGAQKKSTTVRTESTECLTPVFIVVSLSGRRHLSGHIRCVPLFVVVVQSSLIGPEVGSL